jgi:hypothetical protein
MDLLHQSLERTPAHLAKVSIVIRHQLLACSGAIDVDVSPSQIVVRFPEAAIADEGCFCSHASRTPGGVAIKTRRRELTSLVQRP